MSRRSSRLESTGYYDSEGEPSISYKETLHRIFRRRKTHPHPSTGEIISGINSNSISNGNSISNRDATGGNDYDNSNSLNISDSYSNSYSYSYRNRNRNSYSNIYRYSLDSYIHTISNSDTNRNRNSNSRRQTMFKPKIFLFILIILPLCFGLAYLIPTLSSTFLQSESTASPTTITNTDSNSGCEVTAKDLRGLQDELLRLKIHLLPAVGPLPNFALEAQGASILFHLTSETYKTQKAGLTFFGIPIYPPSVSPRIVIQGHSPLLPGSCWPLAGVRGQLFIALSHRVAISHVTLGHISKSLSPTGSISSAPKTFSVYGMDTLDDEGTQLGAFLYDQDGDPVQTFKMLDHKKGVFNYVKLQVESNWGHPDYTCLYSFKVHGKLAD